MAYHEMRCGSSRRQYSRLHSDGISTTKRIVSYRSRSCCGRSKGRSFVALAASGRCAGRRPGGKRGGLRVIYYWAPGEQAFYMLYAYTKSEQGDLTAAQTRQLSRVVREEFR